MGKKRKTLQEKIATDLRRQFTYTPAAVNATYARANDKRTTATQLPTIQTQTLRFDLIKTTVVTGALVVTEVILFFLLHTR